MRKTFGGRQFWTDHLLHNDWRIQRHCRSGRFRLLDHHDQLRLAGRFDECLAGFRRIARDEQIPPMQPHVVVLLHGLGDVRQIMRHLVREIRTVEGFSAVSMNYASTRSPIADHAKALASVVTYLSDASTIHFVSYSMGTIVARHYLADLMASGQSTDKFGRMVMIGSPNHGAQLAKMIGLGTPILPAILGESAVQLGKRWGQVRDRLATPPFEFGILAGSSGRFIGGNPLIKGANDWIIGVEETKLDGAADFRVFPVVHALMPRNRAVIGATVKFLQHGFFESAETIQPLTGTVRETA